MMRINVIPLGVPLTSSKLQACLALFLENPYITTYCIVFTGAT